MNIVKKIKRNISMVCEAFQKFVRKSTSFKISTCICHEINFNSSIAFDLIKIGHKIIFQIVDSQIGFTAVRFIAFETLDSVWQAFQTSMRTAHRGFLELIWVDQGSDFINHRFKTLVQNLGIELRLYGTEIYSSIGNGKLSRNFYTGARKRSKQIFHSFSQKAFFP